MFHKAIDLKFGEGTTLYVTFQDGIIKEYDMAALFDKYPIMKSLEDRALFLKGHLSGLYGIIWTDDIDLEVETVYEDGITVGHISPPAHVAAGAAVYAARAKRGISQKELSRICDIDQSDISKIERGIANPTVETLERIADALQFQLLIRFDESQED